MTLYDVRALRLRPGEHVERRLEVEVEAFELGGIRYAPEPEAPEASLELTRASSGTVFRLRLATTFHGPCQRCLEDAVVPVAVDATEYEDARPGTDEELRTPYLVAGQLDLTAWARDAIALVLPQKVLCREECAGLCPQCGANLNERDCGCEPPAPDSRFAKLADLRDRLG